MESSLIKYGFADSCSAVICRLLDFCTRVPTFTYMYTAHTHAHTHTHTHTHSHTHTHTHTHTRTHTHTHTHTHTGRAGWGYAWYINGSLIPELTVQRGSEYTFITEGGINTTNLVYHPFYITSSIGGGRLRNRPEIQAVCTVFF